MSTIFVSISSYRDQEIKPTILDIIEKSSGKHKITFGVHVSYLEESEIDLPDLPNIKYVTSKVPENIGVGAGRYISHQFYDNEDFYLQCDSHSRFIKGWDEVAIHSVLNYQIQGIHKPLLTMYPANYWYPSLDAKFVEKDVLSLGQLRNISFHENPDQFRKTRIPLQTAMPITDGSVFVKSVSASLVVIVADDGTQLVSDLEADSTPIVVDATTVTVILSLTVPAE
jgi:hypothetical protein